MSEDQTVSRIGGIEACNVLHVDMDAFFASVEVLDNPELAGKPVIVGGSGDRGVVASCTYEARALRCALCDVVGRSPPPMPPSDLRARPLLEVLRDEQAVPRDPEGIHPARRRDRPRRSVLGRERRSATSRPSSEDRRLHPRPRRGLTRDGLLGRSRPHEASRQARTRAAKPTASRSGAVTGSGVYVITPEEELDFLRPLPVRALWGVGPATAERLDRVGVSTVGDLADIPVETLSRLLGPANGRHLAALAHGEDERFVQPGRPVKSISHEETFAKDVLEKSELHRHVLRMADAVGARLSESGLWGRTISVKIRYADRETITRAHTEESPCAPRTPSRRSLQRSQTPWT